MSATIQSGNAYQSSIRASADQSHGPRRNLDETFCLDTYNQRRCSKLPNHNTTICRLDDMGSPTVLIHSPNDHRYVNPDEIAKHDWYFYRSDPSNSIKAMMTTPRAKAFLKSTSREWDERHLSAFKVIDLNDLPIERIIPASTLPLDNDPIMLWAREVFDLSEEDVRSGNFSLKNEVYSFYRLLKVVIERPLTPVLTMTTTRQLRSMVEPTGNLYTIQEQAQQPQPQLTQSTGTADSPYIPSDISVSMKSMSIDRGSAAEDKDEIPSQQMAQTFIDYVCMAEQEMGPKDLWKDCRMYMG